MIVVEAVDTLARFGILMLFILNLIELVWAWFITKALAELKGGM